MTPEQQEKHDLLQYYLRSADKYNRWRVNALRKLFTEVGPRLAEMGGGFHYSALQRYGNLVVALALSWQPSISHLDKCLAQETDTILSEIIFEELVEYTKK